MPAELRHAGRVLDDVVQEGWDRNEEGCLLSKMRFLMERKSIIWREEAEEDQVSDDGRDRGGNDQQAAPAHSGLSDEVKAVDLFR